MHHDENTALTLHHNVTKHVKQIFFVKHFAKMKHLTRYHNIMKNTSRKTIQRLKKHLKTHLKTPTKVIHIIINIAITTN